MERSTNLQRVQIIHDIIAVARNAFKENLANPREMHCGWSEAYGMLEDAVHDRMMTPPDAQGLKSYIDGLRDRIFPGNPTPTKPIIVREAIKPAKLMKLLAAPGVNVKLNDVVASGTECCGVDLNEEWRRREEAMEALPPEPVDETGAIDRDSDWEICTGI